MYLTRAQRNLIDSRSMVHVSYVPIFEKEGTIGYAFKDKFYYKIRLDKSIENNEPLSMSVLIHELGHIELGHMDESIKQSIKTVFKVAEKLGISKEAIRLWDRGPMGVINICMDLEVNDKFLTRQNINDMIKSGFTPVTIDNLELEPQESWKDYIEPYLLKMKDNYNEFKQQLDDLFKSMKDVGEMQTKRMKGRGNQSNQSQGKENEDSEGTSIGKMISEKEDEQDENEGKDSSSKSNESGDKEEEVTQSDMEDDGEDPEDYMEDEEEVSEMITTSDDNYDNSTSYGLSHEKHKSKTRRDTKSPSKVLEDFFLQMLHHERQMMPDSMKHYNRGTRRNKDGLIYTSISRKVRVKPKKLGILIDVSGSMNSKSLLTALDSLNPLLHMLHQDSVVVAWDTDLCGEWSITKLPSYLEECGGTDMARGLRYLSDKGFDTIVIYSDFDTNLDSLHYEAEKFGKELYFIVVKGGWRVKDPDRVIEDQNKLVRRSILFEP